MQNAKFTKNDKEFVCHFCNQLVKPLGYTSRDHCTRCLKSVHIDINPGDRANSCKGELCPINIKFNSKKGTIIEYKCKKCGELHCNKSAEDDLFETILAVSNHTYDKIKF